MREGSMCIFGGWKIGNQKDSLKSKVYKISLNLHPKSKIILMMLEFIAILALIKVIFFSNATVTL